MLTILRVTVVLYFIRKLSSSRNFWRTKIIQLKVRSLTLAVNAQ